MIKKHPYFNPAEAIGQMVDNHMANFTDYGSFVGAEALPKFGTDTPERLKSVTVVSHDASGAIHEDTIPENVYVIKESCEIDLADYADAAGFFIDPSDLTGMNILKIGLKGATTRDAKPFYFVVNNTADYAEDYSDPTPYCEQTPIKSAGRTQVQVTAQDRTLLHPVLGIRCMILNSRLSEARSSRVRTMTSAVWILRCAMLMSWFRTLLCLVRQV